MKLFENIFFLIEKLKLKIKKDINEFLTYCRWRIIEDDTDERNTTSQIEPENVCSFNNHFYLCFCVEKKSLQFVHVFRNISF